MKQALNISCAVITILLVPRLSFAQEGLPGGKFHTQALAAWQEFKGSSAASDQELGSFLMGEQSADQIRYYKLACNLGSANFCMLAAMGQPPKTAAEFYRKGCAVIHDANNCMGAVSALIDAKQMKEAAELYAAECPSDLALGSTDSAMWDYSQPFFPKHEKFKKMLKLACKSGHEISCKILKTKN